MVQRYAHLAPRHLSAHAKQIDSIFDGHVPNMSQLETLEVMGFDKRLIFMALQDSNISSIDMFYMDKIVFDKICTNIYTNR